MALRVGARAVSAVVDPVGAVDWWGGMGNVEGLPGRLGSRLPPTRDCLPPGYVIDPKPRITKYRAPVEKDSSVSSL